MQFLTTIILLSRYIDLLLILFDTLTQTLLYSLDSSPRTYVCCFLDFTSAFSGFGGSYSQAQVLANILRLPVLAYEGELNAGAILLNPAPLGSPLIDMSADGILVGLQGVVGITRTSYLSNISS